MGGRVPAGAVQGYSARQELAPGARARSHALVHSTAVAAAVQPASLAWNSPPRTLAQGMPKIHSTFAASFLNKFLKTRLTRFFWLTRLPRAVRESRISAPVRLLRRTDIVAARRLADTSSRARPRISLDLAMPGAGEQISLETQRRHRDGTLLDVSLSTAPLMVNGRSAGFYFVYRDISDRKRAEALNSALYSAAEKASSTEICSSSLPPSTVLSMSSCRLAISPSRSRSRVAVAQLSLFRR